MWHYRRRRRDLKPEEETELNALFDKIPELQLPYHFREDVAEVFDTAKNRTEASTRLEELREVVASEPDLRDFFDLYDRWRDGILAYFDRRETSAAVEGLNTKARVITRRSYGIKSADSLWRRMVLDVNRTYDVVRRSVADMHVLARGIQARFRGYYT
jgi:transposase